ncbi:MAG: sulfatase [Gemmatimonadales bacterium]|nr:sulfatase [Gemmatimonadales bacterium]
MKLVHVLVAAILLQLVATSVSGGLRGQEPGGAERTRWNILLITADDLGLQLGAYGDSLVTTPHLDSLAAAGVRFEVAYVTQASCSPSRSSMFTGLYPHSTGQYGLAGFGLALHPHLYDATVPALLKEAGYRTGLIGKLHVAPEESFPFDFRPADKRSRRVRQVAQQADTFWNETGAKPFFLMVSYKDPHASWDWRERRKQGFPRQVEGLPEHPIAASARTILPFQQIDTPSQRVRVANYYNAIMRLDAGVGMLLEVLHEHGHAESTLVIFLGDHGPPFTRGKTTAYEAGLRVPFLVRWPGVSKSMVSDAMASAVDILPTILDAAGVGIPSGLHGSSLRQVVSGTDTVWRQYLAAEFHFHGRGFYPRRAIRDHRFKLIHNLLSGTAKPSNSIDNDKAYEESRKPPYAGTSVGRAFETLADPPEFELYDLETDPIEFHNLAGLPEYREVQVELTQALLAWRQETNDPFLDPAFTDEVARRFETRWPVQWVLVFLGAVVTMLIWWRLRTRRGNR